MYTWGYIKTVTLMKLDLEEDEADALKLIGRFKYYANEAMSLICNTIKPKRCYATIEINSNNIGTAIAITEDRNFIGFGDDRNWITTKEWGTNITCEAHDTDFLYNGYKEIIPFKEGILNISYNARWINFESVYDEDTELDAPDDVLECLPSYIASQCMKVDDEYKASSLRNEFEMMVARLDDTSYKTNKTFTIGGDW